MISGTKMDSIIEFYNDMLPVMERYHSTPNARLEKAKGTLSQIIKPGSTVLDIGCGTGITSKHVADIGAKVIAVDIAPRLIEYAIAHSYHREITYLIQDICGFSSKQKFDAILMIDVAEHIEPLRLYALIANLTDLNTHDDTLVYLNMPDPNFARFMLDNYPDKLQIIDEVYPIADILGMFYKCGFIPAYMWIYGLDTDIQYNEYVFVKKAKAVKHYKDRLGKIFNH